MIYLAAYLAPSVSGNNPLQQPQISSVVADSYFFLSNSAALSGDYASLPWCPIQPLYSAYYAFLVDSTTFT
ncbi:hypothetical protein DFP81_105234 [Marinomonas pollencensis]|uniref:Uncharacterized protein n=1 Tax=Marinomonas pollencensis TaxID=491954 RepID=A0A3E0DM29_9GAMM|nr:hypothetical protein DFP81_105234 [Marinomonas pollencensis]